MAAWVSYSEVKAQVSFQDVFALYELLDGAEEGKNNEIAISCPFHDGRSRTLKANDTKHGFKCFAPDCDKAGNVIDFAAAMEGLSFRDAALFLQSTFMKPPDKPHEIASSASSISRGKARTDEDPGRPRASEKAGDTKAASDVAEAVNEPRKTSARGKPPDEVIEVVEIEVVEKTPLETPEKPPQETTGKEKGKGYMREVEAKLRELLHEGDDGETVKWVKAELYASYKRGQASPREKVTTEVP